METTHTFLKLPQLSPFKHLSTTGHWNPRKSPFFLHPLKCFNEPFPISQLFHPEPFYFHFQSIPQLSGKECTTFSVRFFWWFLLQHKHFEGIDWNCLKAIVVIFPNPSLVFSGARWYCLGRLMFSQGLMDCKTLTWEGGKLCTVRKRGLPLMMTAVLWGTTIVH